MPAFGTSIRAGAAYVELYAKSNRLVRGLRLAEARLKAFGQKASAIGQRLLMFSGAAALPFAFATKTFAGFEDQMKAVQAVTGATADEFGRLYDQAKKLGRTTSFTAGEVGAGQLSLARAGLDPEDVIGNVREDYARQRKAREAATEGRLEEIESNRQGTLAALEEDRKRKRADREARYGAALAEAAKDLAGLVRERDDAIAAARAAREAGGGEAGKLDPEKLLADAMAGMGVAEGAAAKATAGTFSAQAAELLGGQPKTLEQIRQEAAMTNRFLQIIAHHARRGEARWGSCSCWA